jgi:hypothetical protein
MNALEGIEGLSECIGQAIQDHLAKSNINIAWPHIDSLNHPILRVEAYIEDAGPASAAAPHSARVASVCFHPLFFVTYQARSLFSGTQTYCEPCGETLKPGWLHFRGLQQPGTLPQYTNS